QFRRVLFRSTRPATVELAVHIPQAEIIIVQIQLRTMSGFITYRIQVGKNVAARAVHINEPHNGNGTLVFFEGSPLSVKLPGILIGTIGQGIVGYLKIFKDLVVEILFTIKQRINSFQECARFSSLNDAVVIGGGYRHHLTDTEVAD